MRSAWRVPSGKDPIVARRALVDWIKVLPWRGRPLARFNSSDVEDDAARVSQIDELVLRGDLTGLYPLSNPIQSRTIPDWLSLGTVTYLVAAAIWVLKRLRPGQR